MPEKTQTQPSETAIQDKIENEPDADAAGGRAGTVSSTGPSAKNQGSEPPAGKVSEALPEIRLEDLPQDLQEAARKANWPNLLPVQAKAIPYVLADRDLMVQSRTGSGKTGAFILPILQKLDPHIRAAQALVLAPTRELARQVAGEAERLAAGRDLRSVVVYGGVGYGAQIQGFKAGAHLVVGTPGRILDHLMRGTLSFKQLKILVFDEADRLMSMGFYPDMRRLAEFLPSKLASYMFSATYPPGVLRLAERFLADPHRMNLSGDTVHVVDTEHAYYVTPSMDKDRGLIRLIELENPESAIIFCNRKTSVDYLTQVLQRFGYDADQLSADLNQKQREKVLARLRDKKLRFLVATDLAARGIDIDRLSHVILYDCPDEIEGYIHRAGRTGRAGAIGSAVSLVGHAEEMQLQKIAQHYSLPLTCRPMPSDEDVAKIVTERVTALLESDLRSRDRLQGERMQRMLPLARSLGESEEELQLMAMLLDDYYQKSLHARTDLDDKPEPPTPPPTEHRSHYRKKRRRRRRR